MATEDKYERLPKWARDEITNLRMRLRENAEEARKRAAKESRVSYHHWGQDSEYIPDDAVVTFVMEDKQTVNVNLRRRYNNPHEPWVLSIQAAGGRTAPLLVIPSASNAIEVFPEPWPTK